MVTTNSGKRRCQKKHARHHWEVRVRPYDDTCDKTNGHNRESQVVTLSHELAHRVYYVTNHDNKA